MLKLKWKNGKPIDWNSKALRLSKLVPNGCSTMFCEGQLYDIERAVEAVLKPFYGHIGWEKEAPIGAVIVSECIKAVDMHSSCYCYGQPFIGSTYYNNYLKELISYGLSRQCAENELYKLVNIFNRFYKDNSTIYTNIGSCEGVSMNGFNVKDGELNVIIEKVKD